MAKITIRDLGFVLYKYKAMIKKILKIKEIECKIT